MADTAIGLLQGDDDLPPSRRISQLEHALQLAANKLLLVGYVMDIRDSTQQEVLRAADDAIRVLDG